jgi:hypothetical protein
MTAFGSTDKLRRCVQRRKGVARASEVSGKLRRNGEQPHYHPGSQNGLRPHSTLETSTMHRALSLSLLALATAAPLARADGSTGGPIPLLDDFEGGSNEGGWSYNPGDVIESTGGNPGGWWHQATADTFGPIIASTNPDLAGDWRAADVDLVSFDAQLLDLDFGTGAGFQMTVLLRDSKGTTSIDDDDFAYLVGDEVPLKGAGWKSFSIPIPSQDTSALPAGWTGGHTGDSTHFRPGIDWNDVITSVDRVEIWWIDPALFAIFQQWNIGLDNVVIRADGFATERNGSGVNPVGYASTATPILGSTWTATVDVATPGHIASAVAVSFGGATEGVFPGGSIVGEMLVLPPYTVDVQAGLHAFPLPNDPALLGLCVATQAATVGADGSIHLNNALDVVIGG